MIYEYRKATLDDLEKLWEFNIADNSDDERWSLWKDIYIAYNRDGMALTFAVICDGVPVGEGTLIFSPECGAISDRTELADNVSVANINALRIRKEHEGRGHISALVRMMEDYAVDNGYKRLTIGVEASETRNISIYLHWGYNKLVTWEIDEDKPILYYAKDLKCGGNS